MAGRILNLVLLGTFLLFFFGCDNITDPDPVPDPTIPDSYELVWSDEFNQDSTNVSLDSEFWDYDLGYGSDGWGNDEWQLYTNATENVRVEDGNMVISALCPSGNPSKRDGSVTSARVKTQNKKSFKYGKIVANIKAPTGTGMWPAFWMLGNSFETASWPYCGEIDIMEISPMLHGENTTMCTMHWWDDSIGEEGAYNSYGTTYELNEPLSDDYHVYEVEWDAQRIIGKIDNITYYTKVIDPVTMSEFMQNYFLIFNVAVGGNLGGAPDDTTVWPQEMLVDWVRVYQTEESLIPIETYGIFTDETPVDAGLEIGANADIVVWVDEWTGTLTLVGGTIPPYEGDNVISWASNNMGWFGGGFNSTMPVDLSEFAEGNLKFMIKMPANVTFKIGLMDAQANQSYVEFPANQTAFGLVRDGEWGQAVVPVANFAGTVNLQMLTYEFIILEENGMQCEFGIDDIYYDGGGTPSSVNFDSGSYAVDETSADISVFDYAAADSLISVSVDNGIETITIGIALDADGDGTGTLNFGPTNDDTDTIAITAGGSITVTYTDADGTVRTDSANISGGAVLAVGIYSESHTNPMLSYTQIINSADWGANGASPDIQSTAVPPVDGTYVLGVEFSDLGGAWGGIAFDCSSDPQDISSYNTLVLNMDKQMMSTLTQLGVKFEDNNGIQFEVNLSNYTAQSNANWEKYEIPLSDFTGVDFTIIKFFLLVNPMNSNNDFIFGNLYFDDIYLEQ